MSDLTYIKARHNKYLGSTLPSRTVTVKSLYNFLNPNLRKHRMFHADVTTNAPKDRTLFNYDIAKDGWPKLRDFLGLPITEESFPHENKNANTIHFAQVSGSP